MYFACVLFNQNIKISFITLKSSSNNYKSLAKNVFFFRNWYCTSRSYSGSNTLTGNFVWGLQVWNRTKAVFSLKNHWSQIHKILAWKFSHLCTGTHLYLLYRVLIQIQRRDYILPWQSGNHACSINLPPKFFCWKQVHAQAWWLLFKT